MPHYRNKAAGHRYSSCSILCDPTMYNCQSSGNHHMNDYRSTAHKPKNHILNTNKAPLPVPALGSWLQKHRLHETKCFFGTALIPVDRLVIQLLTPATAAPSECPFVPDAPFTAVNKTKQHTDKTEHTQQ
ncbi:hypothetical protein BaRGS_00026214 [Batillaria attramentaria]|uniref:Uncharacterized protein n=1 Tax=Batillaria attramentaria TaxID=370345 RepID=A0ABD0K6K7_9CAEN